MQTKLTLRLEPVLIQRAKSYSKVTGKSLSQIVADHFAALTTHAKDAEPLLPPVARSLRGALKGADLTEEDYRRHLEKKYL